MEYLLLVPLLQLLKYPTIHVIHTSSITSNDTLVLEFGFFPLDHTCIHSHKCACASAHTLLKCYFFFWIRQVFVLSKKKVKRIYNNVQTCSRMKSPNALSSLFPQARN
jgi:hypothetical protein